MIDYAELLRQKIWDVFYENADTDEERKWIGTIEAISMSDALRKASEYYEYFSHDLVVEEKR